MPINMYKTIQAGPNNQLGGLKLGFCNRVYQVDMAGIVKKDPISPANWGAAKEIIKRL